MRGVGGVNYPRPDPRRREVEDAAVPVEQVKAALWGWSSRDRRGDRRSNSLEVEDGAAELVGRRDGRRILIQGGG